MTSSLKQMDNSELLTEYHEQQNVVDDSEAGVNYLRQIEREMDRRDE